MNRDELTQKIFGSITKPYPVRDWLLILVVSGILFVAGFTLAAYLFLGVQTGAMIGAPVASPRAPIPVTREMLQAVLETYQARAANFANKSFPAVTVNDPRPKK